MLSTSAPSGSTSSASRRLTRRYASTRAVPIEVVGGDVGVHGHRRAARERRQLQLGQLDDDAVPGRELEQALDQRHADVAAQDGRMHRVGSEHRVAQRGGGGLALGPGDADRGRRAQAQEQVRLAHQRRRRRIARRSGRDQPLQRTAEPRLGGRIVGGDRGRCGNQRGPRPGRLGIDPGPERQRHIAALELSDGPGERVRRSPVVDGHPCTGIGQEPRERDPAAGKPEHGDRPLRERTGAHIVAASGHRGRSVESWSSQTSAWIEARNSVTPSRPARMPTIQNRMVIFSSSQPPSSKWWWRGAIRKTRLPPESLK